MADSPLPPSPPPPPSLASLIKEVSTTDLEASLAKALSADEQQRLRNEIENALEVAKAASIAYTANFVDGSQLDVSLSSTTSVLDAVFAIAKQKGLPSGRVRLLVVGASELLPVSRRVRLTEATQGATELMVVVSSCYSLGTGRGPLAEFATEASFEHYPSWVYLETDATDATCEETELCDGIQVTHGLDVETRHPESFPGILFSEGAPLSGRILMRFVIHSRRYALGLGVATESINLNKDPEYDEGFMGLYHGGHSINVCNCAQRTYRHRGEYTHWNGGFKLAMLVDMDQRTMQCFDGLKPLGPVDKLPSGDEPLWPAVVLARPGDSVSLSVSTV